jgi:HD-like signal output (HDOD) protein
VLLESLNRVVSTKDAIADVRVLGALGSVDALPSPMAVCNELTALMNSDDASASAVAALIEQDPAIVLKLLQVVNSAFFGLRRQTYSIVDAVAYLGTELVKNLVTSLTIINALPVKAELFDANAFHEHALTIARMARHVGHVGELGDTSFVAGMLHDVGKLVMAFAMPELYDEVARRAHADGCSFEEAERAGGTCGHAKIGAYLLDLWGLPYTVVEALVDHDRVHALEHTKLRAADAVYVAHLLLASPTGGEAKEERAYLTRLGLVERLPALVAAADEIVGRT